MMICKDCAIKPICNIYMDVSKHSLHANITINDCDFNKDTTVTRSTLKAPVDPLTGRPIVDRNKINELSNRHRKERIKLQEEAESKKAAKPKTAFVAEPLMLDYTCLGCNANTFKDDASKCSTCGKDICSCCATVDSDTKNLLCPECWEAL